MPDPHVTDFQARVFEILRQIPPGRVTTYKLLAEALDCASSQAVGQALRRNPYAPEVPCHRVINSDLTIGGYAGKTEGLKLAQKRRLLQDEGVRFDPETGKLREPGRLHDFTPS